MTLLYTNSTPELVMMEELEGESKSMKVMMEELEGESKSMKVMMEELEGESKSMSVQFALPILAIIIPIILVIIYADKLAIPMSLLRSLIAGSFLRIFFQKLRYLPQICLNSSKTNIGMCPGKAKVAQQKRSAAPKDKASPQKHANPIQYQSSHHGGGQVHYQQADPDDELVNSTLSNQTGNAPTTFGIEDRGVVSSAMNSSPPNQTVDYADESSDIEFGTPSPLAVNQTPPHDDGNESTPPNEYREGKYELETAFMLGSQILSTAAAVWAKNGTSEMSSAAKCLHYVLLWCIFVSLISSFYSIFLSDRRRPSIAARIARGIACVSTALALLTATGLQLPNHLMVWGTLGAYAMSMPAIIGYAMKR